MADDLTKEQYEAQLDMWREGRLAMFKALIDLASIALRGIIRCKRRGGNSDPGFPRARVDRRNTGAEVGRGGSRRCSIHVRDRSGSKRISRRCRLRVPVDLYRVHEGTGGPREQDRHGSKDCRGTDRASRNRMLFRWHIAIGECVSRWSGCRVSRVC